jgi:hypothetical protein
MKNAKNWYNRPTNEHHMCRNVILGKNFGLDSLPPFFDDEICDLEV